MQLVITMILLSIVGFTVPIVAEMPLMPTVTQAKSTNLSKVENDANIFAARSRADDALETVPDNCTLDPQENLVCSIECLEGQRKLRQLARRSFELQATVDQTKTPTDSDLATALWEGDESDSGHYDSYASWHWRNNEGCTFQKNSDCDRNR